MSDSSNNNSSSSEQPDNSEQPKNILRSVFEAIKNINKMFGVDGDSDNKSDDDDANAPQENDADANKNTNAPINIVTINYTNQIIVSDGGYYDDWLDDELFDRLIGAVVDKDAVKNKIKQGQGQPVTGAGKPKPKEADKTRAVVAPVDANSDSDNNAPTQTPIWLTAYTKLMNDGSVSDDTRIKLLALANRANTETF